MRLRRQAALCILLALVGGCATVVLAGTGPAVLTVQAIGGTTRTVLRLQPGFATVLRADRRIDTVAIGDPRLVTATVVRRGQDAHDLVLQPQAESGATNMVVWFGALTTVWELVIGSGQRTADIVYVVTTPASERPSADRPPAEPSTVGSPSGESAAPSGPPSASTSSGPLSEEQSRTPIPGTAVHDDASGPSLLEVRETVGDVSAVFQTLRARDGVFIRYSITNRSETDLAIRPGGVLVRVNGRIVPYGMARESVDRERPEILPRGATETGVIDAPGRTLARVQLVLSLFPVVADTHASTRIPLTFQPTFVGVDRLPISADL